MRYSYREIRKYCCLTKREVLMIQKLEYVDGIGGDSEVIPDPRIECPFYNECYNENRDCIHAIGTAHSKTNPLLDNPKDCK